MDSLIKKHLVVFSNAVGHNILHASISTLMDIKREDPSFFETMTEKTLASAFNESDHFKTDVRNLRKSLGYSDKKKTKRMTGYSLFSKNVMEGLSDDMPFGSKSQESSRRWKELSDGDKKEWKDKAYGYRCSKADHRVSGGSWNLDKDPKGIRISPEPEPEVEVEFTEQDMIRVADVLIREIGDNFGKWTLRDIRGEIEKRGKWEITGKMKAALKEYLTTVI